MHTTYRDIPAYTDAHYPRGFKCNAEHAGIKKKSLFDVAVLTSESPCAVGATFTTNKFQAAPVVVSRDVLASNESVHSVVVNSGCANACTGDEGHRNALAMSERVSGLTGRSGTLVMSTGVIGQQLPIDKVRER